MVGQNNNNSSSSSSSSSTSNSNNSHTCNAVASEVVGKWRVTVHKPG